ncbi:MAG: hypothetical protein ACTSR0_03900 [Candidatus Asgardarchaeia archaeon]
MVKLSAEVRMEEYKEGIAEFKKLLDDAIGQYFKKHKESPTCFEDVIKDYTKKEELKRIIDELGSKFEEESGRFINFIPIPKRIGDVMAATSRYIIMSPADATTYFTDEAIFKEGMAIFHPKVMKRGGKYYYPVSKMATVTLSNYAILDPPFGEGGKGWIVFIPILGAVGLYLTYLFFPHLFSR